MARSVVTVTGTWQQIGTAEKLTFTVGDGIGKRLYWNDTNSDTAADSTVTTVKTRVIQTAVKDTWVRSETDADGIKLNVDKA